MSSCSNFGTYLWLCAADICHVSSSIVQLSWSHSMLTFCVNHLSLLHQSEMPMKSKGLKLRHSNRTSYATSGPSLAKLTRWIRDALDHRWLWLELEHFERLDLRNTNIDSGLSTIYSSNPKKGLWRPWQYHRQRQNGSSIHRTIRDDPSPTIRGGCSQGGRSKFIALSCKKLIRKCFNFRI